MLAVTGASSIAVVPFSRSRMNEPIRSRLLNPFQDVLSVVIWCGLLRCCCSMFAGPYHADLGYGVQCSHVLNGTAYL